MSPKPFDSCFKNQDKTAFKRYKPTGNLFTKSEISVSLQNLRIGYLKTPEKQVSLL